MEEREEKGDADNGLKRQKSRVSQVLNWAGPGIRRLELNNASELKVFNVETRPALSALVLTGRWVRGSERLL